MTHEIKLRRYHPQGAATHLDHWSVRDSFSNRIVSQTPMSHADAVVLAERLNRDTEREGAPFEGRQS